MGDKKSLTMDNKKIEKKIEQSTEVENEAAAVEEAGSSRRDF